MLNTRILENADFRRDRQTPGNGQYKKRGFSNCHIVTVLPRGEAIRNFVYSGVLDEIGRSARVTSLSVVPAPDIEVVLQAHCDQLLSLREIRERRVVENLREVLDMAHGRWLWSKAAQERWLVHDFQAKARGRRLNRSIKKAAAYVFAHRLGLTLLSKMERASASWLRTTDEYVRLFQRLKPSLLFNGSHVHSQVAIQAVQAAQWLGIPTATFIFSWDNLTSQGRILPQYDYYLVWNDTLRKQLLEIYQNITQEQVIVTGTPQFDFHFRSEFEWTRTEFCERVSADPTRPIVLYSTGMPNHMPGEPNIVERIAAILRSMTQYGPPQLLVRVYPKDQTGRFEDVKRRNPDVIFPEVPWEPAWHTPRIEDTYLLTNTLRHSAAGINIASTISLELCMFDKPVINVGYNPPGLDIHPLDYARYYEFDHYSPLVESGAVRVAQSEEHLKLLLNSALAEPQTDSVNRKEFIKQMFGHRLDGYSSTRIALSLLKLAESSNT